MASLVLGAVGAVVGSAIGGPSGAQWGWNIGVTLGGVLFPPKLGEQNLGKLDDLRLSGSGYGAMIPQTWGRTRIGGNVIWTTDLVEHVKKKKQKSKGGGGQTVNTYSYTASFAVAVCKGPADVLRIWAEDDTLIYDSTATPHSKYNITPYTGDETQMPDDLMESFLGAGQVPAYRGLCYVVFEDLLLTDWGNRIPNMSFEVDTGAETVESVLTDLSLQAGIENADMDYSTATDTVDGFVLAQRASVRDIIDPLLRVYATDITEFGGQLKTVKRGGNPVITLTEDDLGAVSTNDFNAFDRVTTRILMDTDLPSRIDLTYFSSDRLYQQMTQSAVRQTKGLVDEANTVNSLLVLDNDFARHTAERLIYTLWLERITFQFALGPKFFRLGPGDIVLVPINGVSNRVRIIGRDAGLFGELRFTATLDESDVLTQTVSGGTSPVVIPPLQTVVDTHFKAWSCPILRDSDRDFPGFYVAATGPNQWHGCTVYYSTDEGVTWIDSGTILDRSTIGDTTNAPIADTTDALEVDTTSTLSVTLIDTGELESTSQPNVDSGENASLVGDEILGFRTATLTGALEYDLTNLTRGFRNSEMTGHVIPERFILLEETIIRVEVDWSLVGQTIRVKCVSDGQAIGSVVYYQEVTICDPTKQQLGGRAESWVVEAGDTHLSDSDKVYTRDLKYYAEPGTVWLAIRRLMRSSSLITLLTDYTGKPKTIKITVPAGQEFAEGDEIGIWYFEYDSPVMAMKTVKFTVSVAGDQTIAMPEIPRKGSVRVWLREQWLKVQSFNVVDDQLNVTSGDLDIQPGEIIYYAYIPTVAASANYFEDALVASDGVNVYNAVSAPIVIDGESSFIIDVGGRIDPNATIADDGTGSIRQITLAVDMSAAGGLPITIRRYS